MRHATGLLCAALLTAAVRAGEEQDRFEEQAMARCAHHRAERTLRAERGERAQTVRDLEAAFPGKLARTEPGKNDKEGPAWFELLAGTADEWRKTDAVAAGLGPMFERWRGRLELGPVPSIKRDEFLRFAKQIVQNAAPAPGETDANTNDEADKAFRILDANSDGELTGKELSAGLAEAKGQADANGDGRISKDEYREYFRGRVEQKADALATAIRANEALMRKLNPEGGDKRAALPDWFANLDADRDGQVSLFEWRKAGRPVAAFQEMDLNGDGLLTIAEYLRWAKQKGVDEANKKRADEQKKQQEDDR